MSQDQSLHPHRTTTLPGLANQKSINRIPFTSLENIYISPLESCNLHCQYCYTTKTKNVLSNNQILDFVNQYSLALKLIDTKIALKSIIFCGGEVFLLSDFPNLVNELIDHNIFITIITNGTIDRLNQIKSPRNCQLLVSFDGPESIHDSNRGTGNFKKSLSFTRHALQFGFPVEIFFLVTKDSYPYKDSFDVLGLPKTYLVDRLGSLSSSQTNDIRDHYSCYPPQKFGCSILSLQSDGEIYGCCESTKPIGSLTDPLDKIINIYLKKLSVNPLCSDPEYFCHFQP